ncbi:MAG: hypothetical protein BWX80_02811 [Candidatus Hydrogenedentes bacterium ADurb.Bin101]|nr:MAG: hypothetical protein BWX80_02811 [Candidatus Hydrogenedentes bacterium ADurb.Bin101]
MAHGRVRFAAFFQQGAQFIVAPGILGIEFQRLTEPRFGLFLPVLGQQFATEKEMDVLVLGVGLDGLFISGNGLVRAVEQGEHAPDPVQGIGEAGLNAQGLFIMLQRGFQLPLFRPEQAHLHVRPGIVRIQFNGGLVLLDGFVETVERSQFPAQHIPRILKRRVYAYGLFEVENRFFGFCQARQLPAQRRVGIFEVRVQGQGFFMLFNGLFYASQPAEFLRPKVARAVQHRVQPYRLRKVVQGVFRASGFRQVPPEDVMHKGLVGVFREEASIPVNKLLAALHGFHGKADIVNDVAVIRRDLKRLFKTVQGLFIPFPAVIQFSQGIQGARIIGIQFQRRLETVLRRLRLSLFGQGHAEKVKQILIPGIPRDSRPVLGYGILEQAERGKITAQALVHVGGAFIPDNFTGFQARLFNFAAPDPRIGALIVPARLVWVYRQYFERKSAKEKYPTGG